MQKEFFAWEILINGIGRAIEQTAAHHKLTIIRNLGSHGVGRALHEAPEFIAPYYFQITITQ